MIRRALPLLFAAVCIAQPRPEIPAPDVPAGVRDLFRAVAEALVNQDAAEFLGYFDSKMPGYDTLRAEIGALADLGPVTSGVEFVADQGDNEQRDLQIDWVLQIPGERRRRQVLKCHLQREGRKWKIASLDPVEFFKPPAP